jgi:glycosyltransferase involved in cell wall biosynthesis
MAPPFKMKQPVSILMPVYNEADVIEDVVEEWVRDVVRHLPRGSEFIFDEGGSTDGTREILARLARKYRFIRVIWNARKEGFAAAARRLYGEARCPLIFFTDSDGQYIAADFWKVARYVPAYDVVHGAKLGRKDPLPRRLFSALFNKAASFLTELHYLDINSAFRLVKADVVREVLPSVRSMPTLLNAEFLIRCALENFEVRQVYVLHRPRKFGRSRGLPAMGYLFEGAKAFKGLLDIKDSYRR